MGVGGVVRFFSLFLVFLFVFLYSSICYGKMSLSQVRTYLDSPNPALREQGVRALGVIDDPQAVDLLISALDDTYLNVKRAAVQVLGEKKDPRAVEPLVSLLERLDWRVSSLKDLVKDIIEALGKIKDARAVEPLIKKASFERKRGEYSLQCDVVRTLGEIGDPRAIDFLYMSRYSGLCGFEPIYALGKIKDPRVVDVLISIVYEKSSELDFDFYSKVEWKCRAAEVLGKVGDPRGAEAIFFAWKTYGGMSGCGHFELARSLTKIRDQKAVDLLLLVLDSSENTYFRKAAVEGLILMGASFPEFRDQIVPVVVRTLKHDKDSGVRLWTVMSLGEKTLVEDEKVEKVMLKDPRIIEALIDVLDDKDFWIVAYAASALRDLTGVDLGKNKAKWQAWWSKNKKNFMTDAVKDTVKDTTKGTTERATKTTKSSSGK